MSNFTGFQNSPKGDDTKLALVISDYKCVVQFESIAKKEHWLENLTRLKAEPIQGSLKVLRKVVQAHYKVPFWYSLDSLEPELKYTIQCLSESNKGSKSSR